MISMQNLTIVTSLIGHLLSIHILKEFSLCKCNGSITSKHKVRHFVSLLINIIYTNKTNTL